MNKTYLIFRHEFRKTLRRTGFIVLTLSLPVLALLAIGVLNFTSGITQAPPETISVGYVDQTGDFSRYLVQGNITFVPFATADQATQAFIDGTVSEYFVIPSDFISSGTIALYIPQNELAPSEAITAAIKNFTTSNLLSGKVPTDVIPRVEMPLNYATVNLTPTGEVAPRQGGYANFIVPGVFSLLLALSLIFSSTYVIQSLAEEKENRLMEVLVSSVSTRQLLSGKVLGLGAAGLIQVLIWVISLPLLLNLASSSIGGILSSISVPASFWALGVLYFILGYSLFAVLSASVAAVTSSVQEAQGLAALYTLFNVAPLWFLSLLLMFPNSPVWIVFTIFPFTAPVVTIIRLGLTGVPGWQLALSMVVLILSILAGLLLASRLLRIYLLMYGKRPGFGQIFRSLRSA